MTFVSAAPLVETLTMPERNGETPYDGMLTNVGKKSSDEIEIRRRLRQSLDTATRFDPIEERSELYTLLNELLGTGTNDRFVLYCPLYLIPHADWYRRYGEPVDSFIELFLNSWFRMLRVHDIRGDFIDGDIPELGETTFEMVVQAAHITPFLLERQLINRNQIPEDDPILRASLEPQLEVESDYIFNRNKPFYRSVSSGLDFRVPADVSENRAKWLQWDNRRRTILAMAKTVGQWLCDGATVESFGELDADSMEVLARGIGTAVESSWLSGSKSVTELYRRLEPDLRRFHQIGRTQTRHDLRNTLDSVFCRLHSIGFVNKRQLNELGIFYPALEGPLFQNLSRIEAERQKIRDVLQDPELSEIIYPAAVIVGSSIKGYGDFDSDIDLAVFVRPDADCLSNYVRLARMLKCKFGHSVVEYWLKEDGPDLRVHDFPELATNIGDSTNAHVLYGSWEGDLATISMLGERLLKPYLREKNEGVRNVWLREIEHELLLYRLLHRGYERFHVPRTNCVFLDDGYRMVASQLYASHVFIPRI